MSNFFDYTTRILCLCDYVKSDERPLKKGNTYPVGVRVHPLFGPCYYLLDDDGKWTTGYFMEQDSYHFKEVPNTVDYILA